MNDNLILSFEKVSFFYGATAVLLSVDLSLDAHKSLAVTGPSGSGKSTLLAIAGGLLTPGTGEVRRPANDPRGSTVAWVHQTTNVLGSRSVLDNVSVGMLRDGHTLRSASKRALRALRTVGLADAASRKTSSMSGGEVQRVVIARALASKARLIIADEPTGQLDAATTALVLDALFAAVREADEPVGLLVATHDPAVASRCHAVRNLAAGHLSGSEP